MEISVLSKWAGHSEHCPGDRPVAEHGSALFARQWGFRREAQGGPQTDHEARSVQGLYSGASSGSSAGYDSGGGMFREIRQRGCRGGET
jgi:hypothetical protein